MDSETQHFVQSFVRFLNQQISASGFAPDTVESLEVAAQCLETAYNLPVDASATGSQTDASSATTGSTAAATSPPPDPAAFIDLRQLFRTACAGNPERKKEAEDIKNEGNRLMREEKFEEALLCYNRAISLDPTNPVFYCNRAATFSRLGDFQRAADDCHMSLRYEPRYSKAYGRLGIALSKLGQSERAVQAYKKALELEPNNVDYLNNLQVAQQLLTDQRQHAASASASATSAGAPNSDAAAAAAAAGPGGFQLPPNFAMPSMDTLQSVMAQPAVRDFVQQMMGDPGQVDMLRNAFTGGAGGAGGAGGGAADPMAGLANLLGGGGMANIGNLLSQLNGGGAGGPGGAGGAPGGNNPGANNHDQSHQ